MRVEIEGSMNERIVVRYPYHSDAPNIVIEGTDSSGEHFYLYLTSAEYEPLLLALDLLTSSSCEGEGE